jgi:deazaflavin-dependent oxidoreductase (nitroreductase family)
MEHKKSLDRELAQVYTHTLIDMNQHKVKPKLADTHKPRGIARLAFRLPILLYHMHLGRLFGNRLLMLEHIGRKSGKTREAVIEVVRYDKSSGTYIVASGWGEKSDWFRNVMHSPEVCIHAAGRRMQARAVRLPQREAELELRDYVRRHPIAARNLARFMLGDFASNESDNISLLAQTIPLVAFVPDSGSPIAPQ